jgi:hypothetical protein
MVTTDQDRLAKPIAGRTAAGEPRIVLVDDAGKVAISLAGDSVAAAIKAKTDLIPADIVTQLDTNIPAIKAKTDKMAGSAPVTGTVTGNWQSGIAASGETGANLVIIGANDIKNKILSLLVSIHNLTAGATVTVRMFQQVNGTERKVYSQPYVGGVDPAGLWLVDSPVTIHEALRVEVQSSNAADNGASVDYDYMLEVM